MDLQPHQKILHPVLKIALKVGGLVLIGIFIILIIGIPVPQDKQSPQERMTTTSLLDLPPLPTGYDWISATSTYIYRVGEAAVPLNGTEWVVDVRGIANEKPVLNRIQNFLQYYDTELPKLNWKEKIQVEDMAFSPPGNEEGHNSMRGYLRLTGGQFQLTVLQADRFYSGYEGTAPSEISYFCPCDYLLKIFFSDAVQIDKIIKSLQAGWQIYRYPDFGFELELPPGFSIVQRPQEYQPRSTNFYISPTIDSASTWISINEVGHYRNIYDQDSEIYRELVALTANYDSYAPRSVTPDYTLLDSPTYRVSEQKMKIGGKPALDRHIGGDGGRTVLILTDNHVFTIFSGNRDGGPIFDKMLQTFKFLR